MNAMDFLRVSKLLNDCPNCGYDSIGTNDETGEYHGALLVNENLYTRKCRCGFEVTIDANKGTTKKKVQTQINEALKRFKEGGINMKTLKKKIIKAHDKYEFHKLIEEHKHRGWKMLSEIKQFAYGGYAFQVLMGLELEINK